MQRLSQGPEAFDDSIHQDAEASINQLDTVLPRSDEAGYPFRGGIEAVEKAAVPGPVRAQRDFDEPPLRLSQMMLDTPGNGIQPRWMTVNEVPTQLRSSRDLSRPMPGAAGIGRPENLVAPVGGIRIDMPGEAPLTVRQTEGDGSTSARLLPNVGGAMDDGWSFDGLGWEVPPVRWGGSLGYAFQRSSSNTGYSSSSQGLLGNLSAASYIYAPWFARVSGRLGFTSNSASSNASGVGGEGDSSGASNIVGGAEINMFSSSQYPFRAYFDRTDSRMTGSIVTSDYVSNRFGLSQYFRSDDGNSGGNFILDRNVVTANDGRNDEVTAMSASYSKQIGLLQNSMDARYSLGQRPGTGDAARLIGVNSSHIANISDTLNFGVTTNYSDSDIRTASGFGLTNVTRGRFLQLYGYGSWLPEFEDIEDLPLTLNGGLRYSGQDTQFGSESFAAHSFGGNVAALYRYSSNLSLSATGALNKLVQSKGDSQLLTQLGTAVNYVGAPLTIGNFSYNWNAGASANWQSAVASTPANSVTSTQASHGLSRVFTYAPGQTIAFNATQSLNLMNSQLLGKSQTLTNSASANFGLAAGERFSGTLSTMVSDVRTSGYLEQDYQVFNIGLYGQGQLTQLSSANFNLSFSWSDQTYQSIDAFGLPIDQSSQRMNLNGTASFNHQRFAGIRGLRYDMIFAVDTRLRDDRLYGNVYGDLERARFNLTNRLEYRIGLLDFRLSLVNNEVGGKKNALLFFQVTRQVGSY